MEGLAGAREGKRSHCDEGKEQGRGSDGEVEMVGDDQERWREKRRGIEVGEGVGDGSGGAIRAASV